MNVYASLLDQEKKQPTTDTTLSGNNKYSEILGQEREQQMAAVKPVLDMASKITPQHAADAQGLSKKLGLPMDFVERNFDALQKREQVMNVQRAMTFSPILARQMRDPQFAQMAYQDIENLSALERTTRFLKDSGGSLAAGIYQKSAGAVGAVGAVVETLSPLLGWAEGTILPENPLNRVAASLRDYQASIDRTAKSYRPKTSGIVGSGFHSGLESLSGNLVAMPLALFGPSGMNAALMGMVLPVFGDEYRKAKDAGRDQFTSLGYGASQALVEWATEKIPLGKLVGDLKVGAPFYKLLLNQMAREIPGEQAATILQDFNEWMVISPEKTAAQYLAERPGAAAQTLIATIVGVGGQTTVMKGVDMAMRRVGMNDERAADAERQAALLKQITEISQASKVLEASPETFEQFLQAAMEDGPGNSIFIDGKTLMQSGLAEQVAQISPEIADKVRVATKNGGMVQIPVSEYITRIAPTELGNQLLDHIRIINPKAFTRAEARDYMVNHAQALQAEIDAAIAQDADVQAFRDSQERVKQSVLTSLNTLGRFTGAVNEVYATLHAARAATRAAQLGITPEQMFERQLVEFASQQGNGFVLSQEPIDPAMLDQLEQDDIDDLLQDYGETLANKDEIDAAWARGDVIYVASETDEIPFRATSREMFVNYQPEQVLVVSQDNLREFMGDGYNQSPFSGPEVATTPLQGQTEIEVDGVMRSTLNSDGRPIHPTVEGVRNFWRWFGDSKVVDAQGRPLVVYHGTKSDFSVFDQGRFGTNDSGWYGRGIYLTANLGSSDAYAGWDEMDGAAPSGGNVMPLYASIKNPYFFSEKKAAATNETESVDLTESLKKQGYDGVIASNPYADGVEGMFFEVVAFYPEQVKSATGNTGAFDPTNPNILYQSATLRSGRETLKKYGLDPSKRYKTREVAAALEARQRAKYGTIAADDRSSEAVSKIARWMVAEVEFEMDNPEKSGVGWYSEKFQRALDTMGDVFPELKTDKTARDTMTALIAITSDGQKVVPNFAQAMDIYGNFRETGRFSTSRSHQRQDSIDGNLEVLQQLHDSMGAEAMHRYLMQEKTISELKQIAKANGGKMKSDYQAHIKMPMAAVVFGPKLGAFYANLMGAHGYLTMDRWWSRTFNRYRGNLLQAPTRQGLDRFKMLLGNPQMSDDEAIAATVEPRNSYEAKNFKNGTEIEKAANTIWKAAFDALEDAPFNATDRTFMLDAVNRAQRSLKRKGYNLSIADIQAILWYYEKRLYGELGARQTADVSYEEAAQRVAAGYASGSRIEPVRGDVAGAAQENDSADGGTIPVGEESFQEGVGGEYYQSQPRDLYVATTLDDIRQQWREMGIDATISERDGLITLSKIVVPDASRDQGQGTAAMQALVGYADQTGQHIALSPSSDFGGNKSRLVAFYKRFGFVENKGKNKAFSTSETMYRLAPGRVMYQSGQFNQGDQSPRGSYNPQQNIIALLANADLSSFLHESGHYFFESDIALASDLVKESRAFGYDGLKEGEKQILDDVSSLLRWHGIQGNIEDQLAAWNNMDFEEKRAYHERTAESFEKYLMEGKAPSIELQSYFQTFRSWLLNVYKSIKDFLARNPEAGQLNDEVRAVFDRMLATNEQIEVAQTARSMMPLIKTPEDAQRLGLTTDEYEAYQKITLDADQDAAHDLEVKALGDLKWLRNLRNKTISRLQKEASGLRQEKRIEARREVMSQPIYRAWQFLTNRMTQEDELPRRRKSDPDVLDPRQDSLFVAIAKLGGLDRDQARSEWGLRPEERPESRVFGKPVLRVEGGLSIDEMRQALIQEGYVSPETTAAEWDPREFEDKFFAELSGDTQYSSVYEAEVDPTTADRGQLAGRLDLTTLRMMGFNEDQINVLKARKMTAKEGLAADLIAEQFGFSSGDELVRMLLSVPPPREAIEALTDQKMLQEHSELATPEAIEREADRAIHNEARARMITTEVNALNRKTGKRKILMSAARQFAQELIARLKVRDIKPSIYTNAAARAGRAAESAMMKGDLAQAANEKRNQLIQTVAAKAAFDAREEVQRIVRYLNKFDREGTRKAIDPEYMAQIDKMLERFDLRQGQSLNAIDKRTSLADWIAEQEDQGIVPDIPDYLRQEANRTHFKNLTVEEVRGLRDTIQQIEHLGRLKNRLLNDRDKRTLDAIVQEVNESIEANRPEVVDNERRNTLQSRVTQGFRWLMAAHRQLHSLAREMDGYKDGGPFWNVFIRSMNEAGEMEASMRADASRKLHELVKPILAGEKMGGKGKFYPTLNRSLNRGEILAIALNWGNAGNRQRLLDGRGWTEAQILPILETLTEQELQFVQGVWDFFESYRPLIAAKEMRVAGKEPDWVEPAPFVVTATNGMPVEMRGGYYPIKYDPMQSGEADRQNDAEVAKQMLNSAMTAATTRRSYTKSRVDAVKGRPVLLSFEGIYQGANEVIHDLSWHEWLIDANKLLRRLDKPIRDHFGAATVTAFKKTIEDIARGDQPAAHAAEKIFQHLRNGSTIVGLGWNVTTSLLQFTGFFNSMVRVGTPWVARGIREFYGTPSHMIQKVEEAQAKSEFLRNRMRTMNREINDIQNKLDAGKSDLRMAIESSFFVMIQKSQAMVDYPTWYGAYLKALDDPSLVSPDGTIDDAKAVAMADQAVIAAQSGGQVKDLAQIQRGHPAWKLFTNFISYFMTTFQLAAERTNQTNFKKPGEVLGLAMDYTLLMVLPAVMGLIIRDFMKGDVPDDEEELMERLLAEQISFLMGFSPVLREATSAAQAIAGVDPGFGYSGPAGTRFFSDLYRLGVQINQGELDMPLFKAASNTGGILFHLPAGQVNRMVEGTMALIDGKTSNPLAPLVGIPYNR